MYRKSDKPTSSFPLVDASKLISLSTITAVCPHGGPIASISNRHLFIYTAGFEKIIDTDLEFVTSMIAGIWWTFTNQSIPVLYIVLADGSLYQFVPKYRQTLFEKFITKSVIAGNYTKDPIVAIGRSESSLSFIILTQSMTFFLVSEKTISTTIQKLTQITNSSVVCFIVLADNRIVCALDSGEVVLLGHTAASDAAVWNICSPESTSAAQMMSVSFSGKYIAIYFGGKEGKVSVFSTADILTGVEHGHAIRPIDESHVDIGFAPNQLAWVGDDCVALSFSSKSRNVLFVGGFGEWAPYEHEHHIVISSDLVFATILSRDRFQVIQRVHPSSLALDIQVEPEAKLIHGYLKYLANDVESEATIRSIKTSLERAVIGCAEAAAFETPVPQEPESKRKQTEEKVSLLLKASAFGRQFLDTATAPAVAANIFVACAGLIRVCAELNSCGIPMSVPQLLALDPIGKGGRIAVHLVLAIKGDYLCARRIERWLGLDMGQAIFSAFGIDLVEDSAHIPDGDLCEAIVSKANSNHYSLIDIAQFAYHFGDRKKLATDLLQFEEKLDEQVDLLLSLNSDELAMEKSLEGCDVDLIHKCTDSLIGRRKSLTDIAAKLSGRDLDLLTVLVQYRYYSEKRYEDFCKLIQLVSGGEVFNADSALELAISKWKNAAGAGGVIPITKGEEISEWFQFAAERFSECGKSDIVVSGSSSLSVSPSGCQQTASLLAESGQLLRLQVQLEKTAASKGWPRGPHRFVGSTLDNTLKRLVLIGELGEADQLRIKRKMTDGRYWDVVVRTLIVDGNRVEDGLKFVQTTAPPSSDCGGYKTVVEALLAVGKDELAIPYIRKLKPKKQAEIFQILGRHEEARLAAAESSSVVRNVPGVGLLGKLASGIIGNK